MAGHLDAVSNAGSAPVVATPNSGKLSSTSNETPNELRAQPGDDSAYMTAEEERAYYGANDENLKTGSEGQ